MEAVTTGTSMDLVLLREIRDGGLDIVLDRSATRNALSQELVSAVSEALDQSVVAGHRVVTISSSGPAFAAGVDLSDCEQIGDEELRDRFRAIEALCAQVRGHPAVTVGVIDGPAIGAGADLALACDHRWGTDRTRFRFPGPQFGLLLGTRRLSELAGLPFAHDVLLTGRDIHAEEALSAGLLTRAVGRDEVQSATNEFASVVTSSRVPMRDFLSVTREPNSADAWQLLESSMTSGLANRVRTFRKELRR